jgi:hypothetical protein
MSGFPCASLAGHHRGGGRTEKNMPTDGDEIKRLDATRVGTPGSSGRQESGPRLLCASRGRGRGSNSG